MGQQARHALGLGISILALGLIAFFGKGPVIFGGVTGAGIFASIFVVALKSPRILIWAKAHPATTEIASSLGVFMLFQFIGGDTATSAIAATVVCLLTTAVLGFSKLSWIESIINRSSEVVEDTWHDIKAPRGTKKPRRSGSAVDRAIARAVLDQR